MSFAHLHLHTEYSILDGFGKAEQYVSLAKQLGFEYLACTDHANIDGTIKFQKCCERSDIKPVLGCELYVVNDLSIKADTKEKKEKRGHIVVLAKDSIGWNNITKMLTIANIDGFYKKPRVDFNVIIEHCEGIIFLTACTSSFIYNQGGIDFLEKLLEKTKDVYCEIMPIDFVDQEKHNKYIIEIAEKYSLDLVATNDCHYPTNESADAQEVLLAIQTKVKWDDPKRWRFSSSGLYLKSEQEMIESFQKNHQYVDKNTIDIAMSNSILIAEKCNFRLKNEKLFLPPSTELIDEFEYLKQICYDGLYEKIVVKGIKSAVYRKRINYELEIIKRQGFVSYFLIIQDIVNWCKKNDIIVGYGRGSSAGSLVAYLIGITEVDSIQHDLLFERFINVDRVDIPDIDIDFQDTKRGDVRKYIENKYGMDNVASISTFLQMKSKMVFRDVCRVFNIPQEEVNSISPFIEIDKEADYSASERIDTITSDFTKIFNNNSVCIGFKNKYPKIIRYCSQLEGQVRGIGKHAAAVIIANENLRESGRCNLTVRNDVLTINWDKKDAEFMGMLKIDVLGLSNLSIMHYAKQLVENNTGKKIDFNDLDLKDKRVLNEFAKGNCVGIFQFGTYGLRKLCKDLQIDSFKLLTHATAIYRPATLRSGMTDEFKQRRLNGMPNSLHNSHINSILSDTYGVIVYQEQILKIVNEIAGLSFTIADKIRKLLDIEDKDAIGIYKYEFIQGCMKNGLQRTEAISVWNLILQHGSYCFNKSHAVAYTMLSFLNMKMKVYHPTEFICANLTFAAQEKKQELIEETARLGLNVMTPKIGVSDARLWKPIGKSIYMPFIEIKGIGDKFSEKISQIKSSGFFENEKGKIYTILKDIDAYDEEKISQSKLIPFDLFKPRYN